MDDLETIPVCKRCCFCVPLREALITWGYVKLVVAIGSFVVLSIPLVWFFGISWPCILILGTIGIDLCMSLAFIIGVHKKSLKVLRVYYYYVLVMWGVMIIFVFVLCGLLIAEYSTRNSYRDMIEITVQIVCIVVSTVIHSYFVLLLRSEIIKMRSNCPYRFVRNADEGGLVRCEGQMFDTEKTTEVYEKEVS